MKGSILLILACLIFGCEAEETALRENVYSSKKTIPVRDPFLSKYLVADFRDLLQLDVESLTPHQIDSLLKSLLKADQKYREQINTARIRGSENKEAIQDLSIKMILADSINFVVLNRLIKYIGWPSKRIFSDSALSASFFVTLHHTGNEMSYLMPIIEESFSRGEISNDHYAILIDRILIRSGVSQKYGTHCRKNSAGSVEFISLPDSGFVNDRRRQIGLSSLNWNTCDLVIY